MVDEKIAVVDNKYSIIDLLPKSKLDKNNIIAVVLVLIYNKNKGVLLVKRGAKANDMNFKWAILSGKICNVDFGEIKNIKGKTIPVKVIKNAAKRELKEELNWEIDKENLSILRDFIMNKTNKKIYFNLLTIEVTDNELSKIIPDNYEVQEYGFFNSKNLNSEENLGDAIIQIKEDITKFIDNNYV